MGVEPFMIASSCLLIASQVLVRMLCQHCKESYPPPKIFLEELESLHIPVKQDLLLYRAKGCNFCHNTGFKGRVAVMETLEITNTVAELIIRGASEKEYKDNAKKEGMMTLKENGYQLVVKGITTLEEAASAVMM